MATKKNNNNNGQVQQLSTIIEPVKCTVCVHYEVCKYQSKFQAFIKDMNEKETILSDLENFKILLKCNKFMETWRASTITINDNRLIGNDVVNIKPVEYQPDITKPDFKENSITITCAENLTGVAKTNDVKLKIEE